jgi:DNA-binding MarR family transcriptional regulator
MSAQQASDSDRTASLPHPDENDYRSLADFRSVLRRFLAVSDAAAHSAGLTSQRYQALLAIRVRKENGAMSVGELAEQLLVKPHSAAELVNRLEAAGLVKRRADSTDRRRVLLSLTEEGERRLSDLAVAQFRELESHREALRNLIDTLQSASEVGHGA